MTQKQLMLLRDWFREEVEYLIKKNISSKKSGETYYDDYQDDAYYANVAFNKVLDEFYGE